AGVLLGTTQTIAGIEPGDFEDVSILLPINGINDLWVSADDDGALQGAVNECNEDNNLYRPGIDFSTLPNPPVAEAGGPYVMATGERLILDGSGSFDLDAGQGDFITAWDWDIDFDMDFDEGITGERPTVIGPFYTPGERTVGLRVTDNTTAIFPGFGPPDLMAEDTAEVIVYDLLVDDLAARPKGRKIQVTWTPVGDEAAVLRSTVGPHQGFVEIARTSSDYATWLDETVQLNTDYYYRLLIYEFGTTNPIGASIVEFANSPGKSRGNRPPAFTSDPLLATRVGQLYQYDADADDLEGDPLTFSLVEGPSGMTIVSSNGWVEFTATAGQIGPHPVTLQVNDPTGMDLQNYQLVVLSDTNAPPVAEANGPYAVTNGQPVQFNSAGSFDPDADPLGFAWNFGDGQTTNNPNPQHTYSFPGEYIVTLFVTDGRGGVDSDEARVAVTVPNRPPTAFVTIHPTNDVRLGESVTLDGSGSFDLDGDDLRFAWDLGDGTMTNSEGVVHTYLASGNYAGTLVVDDGRGGSDTNAFTLEIGPPNNPPVASFTITRQGTNVGDLFTFDATASFDLDGDPLSFDWDFDDQAVSVGQVVHHSFNQPGDFNVKLTVADNHGGVSVVTHPLHVNHPPVFASTPSATVLEDSPFGYTPVVTDVDGTSFTFELLAGPAGLTMTPGTGALNWTPDNDDVGIHSISLRVSDAFGASAEQSFDLTVLNVNDAPVITSIAPTNAGVNVDYVYQVHAEDDDDDTLTYSLSTAPAGMIIHPDNGRIDWTPGLAQAGPVPVSVRVADPFVAVTQSFTIGVTTNVQPPVADAGPDLVVFTGNQVLLDGSGSSDPEMAPLSYAWTILNAPAGSTLEGLTSPSTTFSFTPDVAGVYDVELIVKDGLLSSAPDTAQVIAQTPPPVPSIDLEPILIDTANVTVDSRTLARSGSLEVHIANNGTVGSSLGYDVAVFEDVDTDQLYTPGVDTLIGQTSLASVAPPTLLTVLTFPLTGEALFKDNRIHVAVDVLDAIAETDELNNLKNSLFDCVGNCLDVSASFLQVDRAGLPGSATLTARLGNAGSVSVPAGVNVAFYHGDPGSGGVLIGVAPTTTNLQPGTFEDVSVVWSAPPASTISVHVVADDNGSGIGALSEADETNNAFDDLVDLAPNLPPVAEAGSSQTISVFYEIQINGSASFDPEVAPLAYDWSIVSSPSGSVAGLSAIDIVNPRFVADVPGDYDIQLIVNDGLQDSAPDVVTITAEALGANQPPVVESQPVVVAALNEAYSYDVDAVDPDEDPINYTLSIGPSGMTINPTSGVIGWVPDTLGNVQIEITVDDGRGGFGIQSYSLAVVDALNQLPRITSIPRNGALLGEVYAYDVEAEDPDEDPLTFSLTEAPFGMTIDTNTGLITWSPYTTGTFPVEITVSDGRGGFAAQSYSLPVGTEPQPVNAPPAITSDPIQTASTNTLYTYDVEATDPEFDPLSFSLTQFPAGMVIDPQNGLISWSTPANTGDFVVAVNVSDGQGGVADQQFVLSVVAQDINRFPPVILPPLPPLFAVINEAYDHQVFAEDQDDPILIYELLGGPAGMALSTGGFITWLPDTLGDFPVEIRVSDPRGAYIVMNYEVRVLAESNQPPQIVSFPPGVVALTDALYSYDVQAVDPEALPLVFVLPTPPSGMTIDEHSCLIQWTPGIADLGFRLVEVHAIDFFGLVATQFFPLLVTDQGVIDLEAITVDASGVTVDQQTLAISGSLEVDITNSGTEELAQPFRVIAFEDINTDGLFTPGTDQTLGTFDLPNVPAPGLQYQISIPLTGMAQFRDNLIHVFVD
ncbi:MAG: PKD domain-containing protein, partial [Verrucomicrobiota bacterium]